MSKLTPMDMAFLLLENSSRQMHMTAYQMFKVPARQKHSFVMKVLKTFHESEVADPFNKKIKWLGKNVASWAEGTAGPELPYQTRGCPGTRHATAVLRAHFIPEHAAAGQKPAHSGSATSSTASRIITVPS